MLSRKISIGKCMALVLIALISLSAYSEMEKIEESFKVKNGGYLVVDSSQGSIIVESWDKKEVLVVVSKIARKESHLEDFVVTLEKQGNKVIVEGNGGWRSRVKIKYKITVPKQFNLDLQTGGGSIVTGDLVGNILVKSSGGSIAVGDIDGDVNVDTSGGSISVGKVSGVTKADTSGGSIKIKGGGKSTVADTSGGSIRIGPSEGEVNADTSGGSISVAYAKGDISVDTSGGSISIEGSDGSVKADTSGGNITIDNTTGAVFADTSGGGIEITRSRGAIRADTAGGNISAELIEDNPKVDTTINLDTAGGSIIVYLPEKLKATVYAELEISRRSPYDTNIYSDFPLTIREDGDSIIAAGDINGGGDKVTLNSSNGDIHIKKLAQ